MDSWVEDIYTLTVEYNGEPRTLGVLIEENLHDVGRKFVARHANESTWRARKAIEQIRSEDTHSVDDNEDPPEPRSTGQWEQEWEKTDTGSKKKLSGQFSYAYDPEEEDPPTVPDDVPITTEEDVRERHNIQDTWVASRKKTKDWTVTMKLKRGGEEVPMTVQNYSINITFKRSERREDLSSFAKAIKDDVTNEALPDIKVYDYSQDDEAYCAMLDLADPHIGRYAWAKQTGRNYDLQLAESIYRLAVDRMLEKLGSSRKLSHIYVPVGHDGNHIDKGKPPATTAGTPQDSHGKWQEISRVVRRCYKYAINSSLEVAPVRIVVIPGNHDERDAWYAGEILREAYKGEDHASVIQENKPTLEKTDKFGKCGFMWFHGKDQKLKDLPTFFANEYHRLWGQTKWREIITGHKHKRTKHTVGDFYESDGAITRISPSLAAPDAWHYRKGYTEAVRGSQCLTWHRELGYDGDIPFNVIDEDKIEQVAPA